MSGPTMRPRAGRAAPRDEGEEELGWAEGASAAGLTRAERDGRDLAGVPASRRRGEVEPGGRGGRQAEGCGREGRSSCFGKVDSGDRAPVGRRQRTTTTCTHSRQPCARSQSTSEQEDDQGASMTARPDAMAERRPDVRNPRPLPLRRRPSPLPSPRVRAIHPHTARSLPLPTLAGLGEWTACLGPRRRASPGRPSASDRL